MPDIRALLWPRSVAVIGASNDGAKLRGRLMEVMGEHAYEGPVYPISRSDVVVHGLKAYPTIAEAPAPVDLAVIIIPARFVPDALAECGEAGVKAAHIITSGFAEEGADGAELQARLKEIAATYDMAVAGPNSEGLANTRAALCPTFSPAVEVGDAPLYPKSPKAAPIAAVAQSGGIGFAFYDHGRAKELPFAYVVSTGNEAVLESLDYVDYLLDEGEVGAIILFLEEVKTPTRLAPVAERALRAGVALIVAKIGRSEAGSRAAQSHTAALAGDHRAYQAIFRHYGVIEADDIEEAVDIAAGFAYFAGRLPKGRRIALLTPSGGSGGWMADAACGAGLEVPELDAETRALIDPHLPSYATSVNPVDVTAQAIREVGYARLAATLTGSPAVDAVVVLTSARSPVLFERDHEALARSAAAGGKPVLFYSYTLPMPEPVRLLAEAGYPLYTNMGTCARTLRLMADYRALREAFLAAPAIESSRHSQADDVARRLAEAGPVLTEHRSKPLLAAYGLVETKAERLVQSADEAVAAWSEIGAPVALKVQSPAILHKSDVGALALDLATDADLRAAYDEILGSARAHHADAEIEGVLVQPMAPPGLEVILGVHRDPNFGPLLMVGLGGVHVEVLGDVAFAPVPLDAAAARRLLDRLAGRALFDGGRGRPPADLEALVRLMVGLSRFAADHSDRVAEIDLNPVLVHDRGLTVADALIVTA
ncbi:MAG: acetate--CoA ligase family protein [Alphaproteobacteria bacterium]|nr:acetate--CoA ligase family protein [Alphaproteobacteria bacterium]